MKLWQQMIIVIGLLLFASLPVFAAFENEPADRSAYESYRPDESSANAQKFLAYTVKHLSEGTMGGSIPLQTTRDELQANYGLQESEIVSPVPNAHFFDRDGYRYFLNRINGESTVTVIQAPFAPLTKEEIFEVVGDQPWYGGKRQHQIIYKLDRYMLSFTHTDSKEQVYYNSVMISPLDPTKK